MNISLLYLVSSSSFSFSPFFVGNSISFTNGRFQKITSLLFYNQKNLLLKDSVFNQIYGSILHNTLESNHIDITDQFSSQNKFISKINTDEIETPKSISIINCEFNEIMDMECNPLKITNEKLSVYITNTLFNLCKSQNGVIFLERCHCLTMTHTCSFKSHCKSDRCFLFYRCGLNDFSIITYNSILESGIEGGDSGDTIYNIDCSSGDQYLRCNNMTKTPFNEIRSEAALCFSFAMITINMCAKNCLSISGEINNNNDLTRKIEMVNFNNYGNYALIRFSQHCSFQFYSKNCVFLTQNFVFSHDNPNKAVQITLEKCLYNDNKAGLEINAIDCEYTTSLDSKLFTLYPHFTYGKFCLGVEHKSKKTARACNVGNCLPEDCERTIGFPEGVVPYTTAFHGDLQSQTFSPTKYFTKSSDFTESFDFTYSNDFTESFDFTYSSDFTKSSDFLASEKFSKSFEFSQSSQMKNIILSSDKSESSSESLPVNEMSSSESDFNFISSETDTSFVPHNGDLGNGNNKKNKGKMIGIIVGVVSAVAVIAIITTVIVIKKRNSLESMSEGNVVTQEETAITVDNALQNEMDKDDPFAADFND